MPTPDVERGPPERRMRLQPGAKLAQFEILDVLGAGGMGEVYRARDTTLRREVALKVLPEAFADDAERLLRLQREARSLAALNHPRIAAIHGFDSVQGVHFLVLELVPGPTLAERVAAGRLPLEQAIGLCRQVAERWRRPTDGASSTAISSRPTSS